MKIGGLQKTSLIDFPDMVSAVVFLQGCNLRCPFCHNPELVLASRFEKGVAEEDFFAFLNRRRGQLDGVVISGGEPTVHADLPDFIARIRALGFRIKLDTNGARPEVLEALLASKSLDFVAMDLKGTPEEYPLYCGAAVPGEAIRRSAALILSSGLPHEFRTTAVPGLHDVEKLLTLAAIVKGADLYAVQAFRPEKCLDAAFEKLPAFDLVPVKAARAAFESLVKRFEVRGGPDKESDAEAHSLLRKT